MSGQLDTDFGVAPAGGYICQNFAEHPDEEVKMQDGPFVGVACPKCGRMAGHPDDRGIPYSDPPHEFADHSDTDS